MRGSGKSTLGPIVAKRLGRPFIDLDDMVLAVTGCATVTTAFETLGERTWRNAEATALEQAFARTGTIVAIGAGAPEHPPSLDRIRLARADGWRIIFLDASLEVIVARLTNCLGDRPMLTAMPLGDELAALVARRRPIYESLADSVVEVSGSSVDDAAWALERVLSADTP